MKKNKNSEVVQIVEDKSTKSMKTLYVLIGLLTFFIYFNTIGNDYNLDDELVTRNHPLTSQGIKSIGQIFTSPYYSDDMGYSYGYRPIVHLSFALEHDIFGEKASMSHLINVLLYIACVLLFLHLLLKWVGERNKWVAIISVLFFALHPIHTEVVASIKNRDELLAFLFALLAGLSMIKYIEKEKWMSLFLIVFYISLAMLSKKSIYALTIILPISAILIYSISWKKLAIILFCFSLPTAIISSESSLNRFLLFLIIPWIGSFVFYYFKEKLFSNESIFKSILDDFNFWVGITVLISMYGIYNSNYFTIPLMIILSIYCFYKDSNKGIILLSLISAIIGLRFNHIEFTFFGFIILANQVYNLFNEKQKIGIYIYIVLLVNILILFYLNPVINQIVSIIAISIFIWLLNKKIIFGILFSAFILTISYILSQTINNFGIILFPYSLLLLISELLKSDKFIKIIPLFAFIPVFFIPQVSKHFVETDNEKTNFTTEINTNQSILLEGRHLEYVENTLVAKHSSTETIGTGLATIGEYAKMVIFPYELSFYYGFSKTKTIGLNNIKVWISLIFHLSLIVLAIWQLKRRPILSIGVGWYLLSILLFSNWFELVAGMVGERLAFTASAGFSIFIGTLVFWIKPRFNWEKPRFIEGSLLVILVLFSVRTINRNSDWKDPITLMGKDVQHLQNSAQANNLYALKLLNNSTDLNSVNLAIEHFKIATTIHPEFFNAQFDLGRNYLAIGDTSNAIVHFKKVIELDNTFPDPYLNLVQIYNAKREWKAYLSMAKKLYKVYNHSDAVIILAKGYLENFDTINSRKTLEKGLKDFPKNKDILFCLEDLKTIPSSLTAY